MTDFRNDPRGKIVERKPLYLVRDNHTGALMGQYSTLRSALRRADKLDLAYGAIRYNVEFPKR